jgi:hypothetical protein
MTVLIGNQNMLSQIFTAMSNIILQDQGGNPPLDLDALFTA